MATTENNKIVVREKAPQMELKEFLDEQRGSIQQILTENLSLDRVLKVVLIAAVKNPRIYECTHASIIKSIMDAASLGFELGNPIGHAYAVPRKNRHTQKQELTMMVGYKGYINLAVGGRIGSVEAHVVYDKDDFKYRYGTDKRLDHTESLEDNVGKFKAVYAIAYFTDGTPPQFEVMRPADVEAIRKRSQTPDSGPWVTDYGEMAKKTVAKRLIKYLPLSVEAKEKIAKVEAIEEGDDEEPAPQVVGSQLARKIRDNTAIEVPQDEPDDQGFGEPEQPRAAPPPQPIPPAAPVHQPPAPAAPPVPQAELPHEQLFPESAAPPQTAMADEAEITSICKTIFGCASLAEVEQLRADLSKAREKKTLNPTKDQGQRIRQAIEAKINTLKAQQSAQQ
jgi:recombination protein RecT